MGKTASEMAFPSKECHKRLSNLDQNSFLAGNLKDTPISKNAIKQCAYEYRQSTLVDADLVKSLQIIKEKYISELEFKAVPGFLQFFSIQRLTVALWTQIDVELYHRMSSDHCLLVDATGSIATANDLSVTKVKTFVHISLCHAMKAFARKVNKCFKGDKSLLANAPCFSYILDISRHLLSKYSSDCKDSKVYLEKKMDSKIESCKKLENDNIDSSGLNSKMHETNIENDDDELPVREVVYLQQSKRSRYFKDCESFLIKIQEGFKHDHASTDDLNVFFSSTFAIYFLNNWCGLIPFWTSIQLGDQGRHGKSEPYKLWSEHFSDRACIKDPPRTQGIIEFHHKPLKHLRSVKPTHDFLREFSIFI